jgi:hypothetical protein
MKKIAFILMVLMVPVLLSAQSSPLDKLFDKYYGHEGFTTVLVNQDMFEVLTRMEKSEGEIDGEMGEIFGNIKRVRVLAQEEEGEGMEGINFMEELEGMSFDEYKELVFVKESDEEVRVLAKEAGGKLGELLIIVSGDDNVLVSIEGMFSMEDLGALSGLEGLDALEGLDL